MTLKTSSSHPLWLGEVAVASSVMGLTLCPGKFDDGPAQWSRDLDLDLAAICAWGATELVTLIEDFEFRLLRVPMLGQKVLDLGLSWHHLPIVDGAIPDARFESGWRRSGPVLLAALRRGERVAIHCRGGLGRAGTTAARLLVELGIPPEEAIVRVRAGRPGAIENAAQEAYVRALGRNTRGSSPFG